MIAYSNKIVQWVWHFNQMRFYSFKGADSKVYEIHFTIILKDVVSCQKTYYERNQIENKTSEMPHFDPQKIKYSLSDNF